MVGDETKISPLYKLMWSAIAWNKVDSQIAGFVKIESQIHNAVLTSKRKMNLLSYDWIWTLNSRFDLWLVIN